MINKNKILIHFGTKLRQARLSKELSQEGLALSLKFDRTYVGLLERKKRNTSFITVHKIAEFPRINPSELF